MLCQAKSSCVNIDKYSKNERSGGNLHVKLCENQQMSLHNEFCMLLSQSRADPPHGRERI